MTYDTWGELYSFFKSFDEFLTILFIVVYIINARGNVYYWMLNALMCNKYTNRYRHTPTHTHERGVCLITAKHTSVIPRGYIENYAVETN